MASTIRICIDEVVVVGIVVVDDDIDVYPIGNSDSLVGVVDCSASVVVGNLGKVDDCNTFDYHSSLVDKGVCMVFNMVDSVSVGNSIVSTVKEMVH